MAKEIRKLGDLATLEVSLVTKGANRKRFALVKSEEEQTMDFKIFEAVLKADMDGEDKIAAVLKGYSEKGAEAFKAMFKIFKGFEDELPKTAFADFAEALGVKVEKAFPFPKKDEDDEEMDPKAKKKLEAMQKSLEDDRAKLVAVQKALDTEREERRTRDFIVKAEAYKALPGVKTEELGAVLKSLTDHAPDYVAKLEAVLKTASEAIAQGELLRQAGSPGAGSGAGSAWAQIEALADKVTQKSESGRELSKAEKVDVVLKTEEGARLMKLYESENPRQYGTR